MVNQWYIWLFKTDVVYDLPAGVEAIVRKKDGLFDYIACCPRPICMSVAKELFKGVKELDHNPGAYRWPTVKYLFLNDGPFHDAGFSLQLSDEGCSFNPPAAKRGRPTKY